MLVEGYCLLVVKIGALVPVKKYRRTRARQFQASTQTRAAFQDFSIHQARAPEPLGNLDIQRNLPLRINATNDLVLWPIKAILE